MRLRIIKMFTLMFSVSALTFPVEHLYEKEGYYRLDSIVIYGATNISEFTLTYSQDLPEKFYIKGSSDYELADTSRFLFSIPVKKIKSDRALARKGFMNLIEADTYEFITIALFQRDLYRILSLQKTYIIPLRLTIAGETFEYFSPVDIEANDEAISVKGEVNLFLTDFKLEPPVRFLGLIKAGNEVKINYRINFTE